MENEIAEKEIVCPLCASRSSLYVKKNGYDVYRCGTCNFRFVFPIPKVEDIYSDDYFSGAIEGFGYVDYDRDKEPMVPTFQKYLKRVRTFAPNAKILFDIGAATGFFLSIAKRYDFKVQGVEISPFAASIAAGKGIPVIAGTLEDFINQHGDKKFDVVTLLDVIEHVSDPWAELKRVHDLLTKGGLVVINTPDAGSIYARIMGTRWHLLVPPEHLFYFNRKNMTALLEALGFKVIFISTIGKSFTLSYIFKTLYGWQKLAIWNWLSEITSWGWFKKISLPINLGDNFFLIAKKNEA